MRTIEYNLKKNNVRVELSGRTINIFVGKRKFFANYPVEVEDCEEYLINLMIWILFYNCGENLYAEEILCELPPGCFAEIKNDNYKTLLCYSGGVDSTAALLLYPGIVPVYLTRSFRPEFDLSQMNAVDKAGALVVDTDFEMIYDVYRPGGYGYNMGDGYMAVMFPLVNKLKIRNITFGGIFDDVAFWYGEPFTFNTDLKPGRYNGIRNVLSCYAIGYVHILAGVSEVLTTRFVHHSAFRDVACSCHVPGLGSNHCRECYKCFRKLGILGQQIRITDLILSVLKHKPLKMAASTIYGIQRAKYKNKCLKKYMDVDVSWLERYNDEQMRWYNTEQTYNEMVANLTERGIEKQTPEDIASIEKFVGFLRENSTYDF